MCGIWAIFGLDDVVYEKCKCAFEKLKHRGPDSFKFQFDSRIPRAFFGFHRLSIVHTPFGNQPIRLYQYPSLDLLCNGELYNYKKVGAEFGFKYETGSDVECILHLVDKFGIEKCAQQLDGVFAFIITDAEKNLVHIARDPFGVRPLFRLVVENGFVGIASEAKGLIDLTKMLNGAKWSIQQFPPGHYATYSMEPDCKLKLIEEKQYYQIGTQPKFTLWKPVGELTEDVHSNIRALLTAAVDKRLMSDRRIGCLLSGGLDSSLISALLVKLSKERNLPYKVQSFAIGMDESPDILAARQVANYIGTEHYEIIFNEEDVIDAIDDVIYYLETCDITTIRASIGMYLIAKYIKTNTDTTVIFSGEGADELAQGYIFFRDAPSSQAAHEESLRLLSDIYLYDGLRADRTTSAHSLEIRVPFLDQQFTSYFLNLPVDMKRPQNGVEKHLLRSSFDAVKLLPDSILWRHKEAFSDGVANLKRSLFKIIQDHAETKVTDAELANASLKYSHLPPKTKESYYYREVFEKYYPNQAKRFTPYIWMPKWTEVDDPSARFIKHYAAV